MFKKFLLRIGHFGKFNLVSPFISFAASAVRLPKRNEQGRLCGKEKGSRIGAPTVQSFPAQALRTPRWTGTPPLKVLFISDLQNLNIL
jgi:hypothetical protein